MVGTNEVDMAEAVNVVKEMKGGFVVVRKGKTLAVLELPIAGLLSMHPVGTVIKNLEKLNESAKKLGCKLKSPFMTLTFVGLTTVPDLGLTDKGLFDVKTHAITNVLI